MSVGDVNFDHMVKFLPNFSPVVTFCFLNPLQLISNLWEETLRPCKYPASHHSFLFDLVSVDHSCLIQSLL